MKKNAKALSPVVASIILIAVTVAVSIAVGVWMFGLSGSFMGGAEQLKVTQVVFYSPDQIEVRMANTGTSPITVNEIWVTNNKITTTSPVLPTTLAGNAQAAVNVTYTWSQGYSYEIKVVTAKGTTVTYPVSAPTS